jgi:hypothetical protein
MTRGKNSVFDRPMMKRIGRAVTPASVRTAVRRGQGWLFRPKVAQTRSYQGVSTIHSVAALHRGRFAEIYDRYWSLDPFNRPSGGDRTRMRVYNLCLLAEGALRADGDIVTAGVSWGVAQRVLYDYLDIRTTQRTLHMIDPFLAVADIDSKIMLEKYNSSESVVRRQYETDARICIERAFIPDCLPLPAVSSACVVYLNTGDFKSEARSIASLWPTLNAGGVLVIDNYAIDDGHEQAYRPFLPREPFVLPTGQAVLFK